MQAKLEQPNSEPIQIKKRAKSMDENISDFIDRLNLSNGSKMHLLTLVSEIQSKKHFEWENFLTFIKNEKELTIDSLKESISQKLHINVDELEQKLRDIDRSYCPFEILESNTFFNQ